MRLRVVRDHGNIEHVQGRVPFGNDMGFIREEWHDGVVVMLGNECAPDHTIIIVQGEAHFFDGDGPFTPRVEEWADSEVEVLLDTEVS